MKPFIIYRYLAKYKNNNGNWYHQQLRICSKKYRKKRGSKWTKGQIPNRIYIDQRPDIVDKKERVSDWEADSFEFYEHSDFAKALAIETYFAFPYHSWERGLNENTNGLIRQYFPKRTDFNRISHQQIAKVQHELNNHPRKTLAWATPNLNFLGNLYRLFNCD